MINSCDNYLDTYRKREREHERGENNHSNQQCTALFCEHFEAEVCLTVVFWPHATGDRHEGKEEGGEDRDVEGAL